MHSTVFEDMVTDLFYVSFDLHNKSSKNKGNLLLKQDVNYACLQDWKLRGFICVLVLIGTGQENGTLRNSKV